MQDGINVTGILTLLMTFDPTVYLKIAIPVKRQFVLSLKVRALLRYVLDVHNDFFKVTIKTG